MQKLTRCLKSYVVNDNSKTSNVNAAFSPNHNTFVLACLHIAFKCIDRILPKSALKECLWQLIKLELFYIDGRCQHSGNCCKRIMLCKGKESISTISSFEAIKKKNPTYQRFDPHIDPNNSDTIQYFNCTKLHGDNVCLDYEGRPSFCKQYPLSNFVHSLPLHHTCGYSIRRKNTSFTSSNPCLTKHIDEFQNNAMARK